MATESKFKQFFKKNMPACILGIVVVFLGIVVSVVLAFSNTGGQ